MEDIKRWIGIRIGEIRKKKGFTQEDLAGRMEIGPKYLSSIERGKENPTLNTLIRLAQALEVDMGELFSDLSLEDPNRKRAMVLSLVNEAEGEQLKLAYQVLALILR
jgi:transcriptional regulator with XRE-family HTH domain